MNSICGCVNIMRVKKRIFKRVEAIIIIMEVQMAISNFSSHELDFFFSFLRLLRGKQSRPK